MIDKVWNFKSLIGVAVKMPNRLWLQSSVKFEVLGVLEETYELPIPSYTCYIARRSKSASLGETRR